MIEEEKDNSFRGILRKMFLGETREERISREFESRKLPQKEDSFFKLGRKQEKKSKTKKLQALLLLSTSQIE